MKDNSFNRKKEFSHSLSKIYKENEKIKNVSYSQIHQKRNDNKEKLNLFLKTKSFKKQKTIIDKQNIIPDYINFNDTIKDSKKQFLLKKSHTLNINPCLSENISVKDSFEMKSLDINYLEESKYSINKEDDSLRKSKLLLENLTNEKDKLNFFLTSNNKFISNNENNEIYPYKKKIPSDRKKMTVYRSKTNEKQLFQNQLELPKQICFNSIKKTPKSHKFSNIYKTLNTLKEISKSCSKIELNKSYIIVNEYQMKILSNNLFISKNCDLSIIGSPLNQKSSQLEFYERQNSSKNSKTSSDVRKSSLKDPNRSISKNKRKLESLDNSNSYNIDLKGINNLKLKNEVEKLNDLNSIKLHNQFSKLNFFQDKSIFLSNNNKKFGKYSNISQSISTILVENIRKSQIESKINELSHRLKKIPHNKSFSQSSSYILKNILNKEKSKDKFFNFVIEEKRSGYSLLRNINFKENLKIKDNIIKEIEISKQKSNILEKNKQYFLSHFAAKKYNFPVNQINIK